MKKQLISAALCALLAFGPGMAVTASAEWHSNDSGYYYTDDETGERYKSSWHTIDNVKYYFDKNGYSVRGLKKIDGKYWMMYHSYPGEGYESGPAEIGLAWTADESLMHWEFSDAPVFSWRGGASFERGGLYKCWLIEHEGRFYLFYNAKDIDSSGWIEQTGGAVSDDMFHWKRLPDNPILPVTKGAWDSRFCSDPVVKWDSRTGLWVMFYYGLGNLSACDGLAFSRDLLHWEKYPIPILTVGGAGTIDSIYAHKPGVIAADGALYHFYCACRPHREGDPADNGGEFRCISVARSQPWT